MMTHTVEPMGCTALSLREEAGDIQNSDLKKCSDLKMCDAQSDGLYDTKNSLLSPGHPGIPSLGMAVAPPTPTYLWIGCADSRLVPNQITGLPAGDIFISRNVGNVVKASDPNCMSTLEYAINCLRVKHIIVCGHYSCAAVQAAMKMQTVQLPGLLNFWIADIREAQNTHTEELKDLSGSQQLSRLCELNVIRQAFNVCTSPVVQAAWGKGQYLHIHAMIFDTKTGLLTRLAGPIAAPVMDASSDNPKQSLDCAPSPAPSECSSSQCANSTRYSRSSSRPRRMAAAIPKSVLAACKDSAEVEALHAMSRYLETCGCVPDMENLLGLGAKLGGSREDLASTSKGLKELEDKYSKIVCELQDLKAAKVMAEDAQEHLTQQAQWLMKEKSELVQRMAQREQLINNLQERLEYVQAECQQLRGDSPDALLEELTQLATDDPSTLTPELLAEMRILTSLASGELAREVANSVCNAYQPPSTSATPSHPTPATPLPTPHGPPTTPASETPQDSIPAGKSLFARFLEDDQAVRSATAAVLARADSAGPSQPDATRPSVPLAECCSCSITSAGLGEYRYLTLDDADRPSMQCPWTPPSSHGGPSHQEAKSGGGNSLRSEPQGASQYNGGGQSNSALNEDSFAFSHQWERGSTPSEMGLKSVGEGERGTLVHPDSAAGTSAVAAAVTQGAAVDLPGEKGLQEGVLTVKDLPPLPALKLPPSGAVSPLSVQAGATGLMVPRLPQVQPTGAQTDDSPNGPLTQRSSVPASTAPSGYTTPVDGATEVGFGDDTWALSPKRLGDLSSKDLAPVSHLASLSHRRRNVLQQVCDFVADRLQQCGADRWGVPLMQRAALPGGVALVALLWLVLPSPAQRRKAREARAAKHESEVLGAKSGRELQVGMGMVLEDAVPVPADTAPASAVAATAPVDAGLALALPPTIGTQPTDTTRTMASFPIDFSKLPTSNFLTGAQPADPAPPPLAKETTLVAVPQPNSTDAKLSPHDTPVTAPQATPAPHSAPFSPTSPSPWDTLTTSAVDLVEQLEKRLEQRLALSRPVPPPPRSLQDIDIAATEAWLLQNGWDARWGCCDGLGGDGKVCVLRSAQG